MNSTQNMPEMWKPVVGYEGLYEVSDLGNVRSVDRTVIYKTGQTRHYKGRTLKLKPAHGYWRVELNQNGKPAFFQVHRLVLAAFVGPLPEGKEVCHNNGNPGDNRLENLRYGTKSENQLDRVKHGTHHEVRKTHCPRGHRLADPNLRADQKRKGKRTCLACGRAAAYVAYRKELKPFKKQLADSYYEQILGYATNTNPPGAHITITWKGNQ